MRVAAIQMTSVDDVGVNLAAASKWIAQAADQGAELVALPENFAFLRREGDAIACAQTLDGEIVSTLRDLARRHRLWIVGGTFHEAVPGDERVANTCVAVDPRGDVVAVYRKIHLFDVDLSAQGGHVYRESERVVPGDEIVSFATPYGGIGLSVCYDVRFPELYRELSRRGVRMLCVPAAFARETGRDHWEVLLRARAIENQCWVIAPAQCGEHPGGRQTYGRSMIVDPWGLVRARAADRPGLILAECPAEEQDRIRAGLPALRHRRLGESLKSRAGSAEDSEGDESRPPGVTRTMGEPIKRAALVIRTGGFEGTRYELAGDETLIGRNPTTDITLLDEGISREHAIIVFDPERGRYEIEDLESTNGTKVNGRRVRNATLAHGDEIQIGHTVFVFAIEG